MKKLFLVSILFIRSGCHIIVLDAKSGTASDQIFLIIFSFWIMMIVVSTVFVLVIWFVYKYTKIRERLAIFSYYWYFVDSVRVFIIIILFALFVIGCQTIEKTCR
ncbi:hypothetical protein [Virgibacillus proomii]|uniref:hypothetical protein n=1 Tax=Virgibacillus proomii TaxID=84407 RepID=UPI001C108ADD|nr:hypothetical protein [Virgibacillus proomii]MBU5267937.1 hypothetical protein [Virgibacillus proomii]